MRRFLDQMTGDARPRRRPRPGDPAVVPVGVRDDAELDWQPPGSGASLPAWMVGLVAAVVFAVVLPLAIALAAPSTIESNLSAYVTDGDVYAVARGGGNTYIGGKFNNVGPRTGHGVQLSQSSGVVSGLPEVAGGEILAVEPDGAGGWYIGGSFTHVGNQPRSRLAHISGGSVDGWAPNPNDEVLALNRHTVGSTTTLYVGGKFTNIGNTARDRLAAFGVSETGTPNGVVPIATWNPGANNTVYAIRATAVTLRINGVTGNCPTPIPCDSGTATPMPLVFVGGDFTKIPSSNASDNAQRIAAIWGVGAKNKTGASSEGVLASAASSGFNSGSSRAGTPVRALAIGATADVSRGTSDVGASVPANPGKRVLALYAAGDFAGFNNSDRLTAIKIEVKTTPESTANNTGDVTMPSTQYGNGSSGWNPSVGCAANTCTTPVARALALSPDGSTLYVGGEFTEINSKVTSDGGDRVLLRNRVAALSAIPNAITATATVTAKAKPWNSDSNGVIRALAATSDKVFAGGDFTSMGGTAHASLAALNASTGSVLWDGDLAGGRVSALSAWGPTSSVYAGGTFVSAGAKALKNLAALDNNGTVALNGSGNPIFDPPDPNDKVNALAWTSAGLVAGGNFTDVGGIERLRIAAFNASSGSLLDPWQPGVMLCSLNSTTGQPEDCSSDETKRKSGAAGVLALAVSSGRLYVGGAFNRIGADLPGKPCSRCRGSLASFEISKIGTGASEPTDWNPGANGSVNSLYVTGSTVFAGGGFTRVGADYDDDGDEATAGDKATPKVKPTRNRIAMLAPDRNNVTTWDPDANSVVRAFSCAGNTLYAGGQFSTIGGAVRQKIAALDGGSGQATGWNPSASETVRAVAASSDGQTVYAGGSFTPGSGTGASIGGQPRHHLAALSAASGNADPWNPDIADGGTVYALTLDGALYAGGVFERIGNRTQARFAQFSGAGGPSSCSVPLGQLLGAPVTGGTGGSLAPVGGAEIAGVVAPVEPTGPIVIGTPFDEPVPIVRQAPEVLSIRLTRRVFRVSRTEMTVVVASDGQGERARSSARGKDGTTFVYVATHDGTVEIDIKRKAVGYRLGRKCRVFSKRQLKGLSASGKRRVAKARRCKTTVREGQLVRGSTAGRNKAYFSGRFEGDAPLVPGLYTATIHGVGTLGDASSSKTVPFKVVR